MSTVSELFPTGGQYKSQAPTVLTFTIPARTTAIAAGTIEFVTTDGSVTLDQMGDMKLTSLTGENWQKVSAKSSNNSDGNGVWAWYYRNDTDTDATNVQIQFECPDYIGYNPLYSWASMGITGGLPGTPFIGRVPTLDSYVNNNTGSALSTTIDAAVGGRAIAIVRQDSATIGAPAAGNQLLGAGNPAPGYSLAMYYRTSDEVSAGTVTVGSSDTGTKGRIIALSFPDPMAGGQTSGSGAFLSILSRMGLGNSDSVYTPVGGGSGGGTGTGSGTGGQAYAAITHGQQLTKAMVGHTALNITTADLDQAGDPNARVSNYPGNVQPTWLLTTPYVYNDDPSNKGGVVPAGGMVIDGVQIPAGVYVVQFLDFSGQQVYLEGSLGNQYGTFAGIMFRGCRWRGASPYVGWVNEGNNDPGGPIWFHYCDAGGLSSQSADYCEIPIKLNYAQAHVYRCYLSYCTTATQNAPSGSTVIETYIDRLTTFNTNGPHLNGISVNGGQLNYRIERNNIVAQQYEDNGSGKTVDQTDCIAFFQDFGDYPGTGTNNDGTVGYRVIDNYVGGTGYCIYAGQGPNGPVNNMYITGTKVTTSEWPNGGVFGPLSDDSSMWGTRGNTKSNNTWADGPNVGQAAF